MDQRRERELIYDRLAKRELHQSHINKMHHDILKFRSQGHSIASIALDLGLSESTVRTVMDKYDDLIDKEETYRETINHC